MSALKAEFYGFVISPPTQFYVWCKHVVLLQ